MTEAEQLIRETVRTYLHQLETKLTQDIKEYGDKTRAAKDDRRSASVRERHLKYLSSEIDFLKEQQTALRNIMVNF
jgi:predicted  nucleic acid-binding Zn-ribbon protein